MTPQERRYFDQQLERVLAEVPPVIHSILEEVPLYVEDYPPKNVLRKMGLRHRWELCGLYTGIPLIDRSVQQGGQLSDAIQLFREGIMALATDRQGRIDEAELRRQIRITLLHELGHHHGLDEDELEELGY